MGKGRAGSARSSRLMAITADDFARLQQQMHQCRFELIEAQDTVSRREAQIVELKSLVSHNEHKYNQMYESNEHLKIKLTQKVLPP